MSFSFAGADIKANGLREPITLHPDGSILDGRNLYRACLAVGVDAVFTKWDSTGTPEAFVISKNLARRLLNESQRAMMAKTTSPTIVGSIIASGS